MPRRKARRSHSPSVERLKCRLAWWQREARKARALYNAEVEHARTAHGCDGFVCRIVNIKPMDTPFKTLMPKVSSKHVTHRWVKDSLRPYTRFRALLDRVTLKVCTAWYNFTAWLGRSTSCFPKQRGHMSEHPTNEEFQKMLELIYETGGNPEYVVGKCPHCGDYYEYENGDLLQGHFASECPHAPPRSTYTEIKWRGY